MIALRQLVVVDSLVAKTLQIRLWGDDNFAMTSLGFAVTVFLGSSMGLFVVYPDPNALDGISVFALFNAGYAWLAGRVASMAWQLLIPHTSKH